MSQDSGAVREKGGRYSPPPPPSPGPQKVAIPENATGHGSVRTGAASEGPGGAGQRPGRSGARGDVEAQSSGGTCEAAAAEGLSPGRDAERWPRAPP